MKIRTKMVLVFLPVMITIILAAGVSSYFTAAEGINRIAGDLLGFKVQELEKYIKNQWNILLENGLVGKAEMEEAAEASIQLYADSVSSNESEVVATFDSTGNVTFSTREPIIVAEAEEMLELIQIFKTERLGFTTLSLGGVNWVVKGFYFDGFDIYYLVMVEEAAYYKETQNILYRTAMFLIGAVIITLILLMFLSSTLTSPLKKVVETMKKVIQSGDLSSRVEVEYNDETGELAQTFNMMTSELDKAYSQIKNFAFQAVLAQKNESKIRQIFQKYVPQELINKFFENPESMLVGDDRQLSILFSDIRSFTTISESMSPDDLVRSLNAYFSVMVDLITNRKGIVDKYIGDAIMAFWGAPVAHDDDPLESVMTGIEMSEEVKVFNEEQIKKGKPEFRIGVGINYGHVTVGNIGTDKKMDYTVIGDPVNLASRLEGLTKMYKQELIISESLYEEVKNDVPCRLLDSVAVKGKTKGVKIYSAQRSLNEKQEKAWPIHHEAMNCYYEKRFKEGADLFKEVDSILSGDFIAESMRERCLEYEKLEIPENWDGVRVMKTK